MSSSSPAETGFAARRRIVERRRRLLRRWRGRAVFALTFAIVAGAFAISPVADFLQRAAIDGLFFARHTVLGPLFAPATSDVAVVVIDEETYLTPPFADRPRVAWTPHVAKIIEAIDAAGPRVIGYTLVDPTSLDQPDLLPRYDRPLLRAFAQAGRAGRLVLGELRLSGEMISPYRGQRVAVGGDDNLRLLNLLVDDDEVVRQQTRSFRNESGGDERLSFAVELAKRAGAAIPASDYLINFNTGPSDLPEYSFADLLACAEGEKRAFFASAFKDKIVIIGTALDVEDRRYSAKWLLPERPASARQVRCILPGDPSRFDPLVDRRTMPSVFIHAAAVNTLTKGLTLRMLGPTANFVLAALSGLLIALVFFALPPLAGAGVGLVGLALQAGAALLAFAHGIVAPIGSLFVIAATGFAIVYAYRFVIEDRDRRRIAQAFQRYLSPTLVERLAADPSALRLGGESRRVTVMFADIVGYTALTERLAAHPERLVEIVNRFLSFANETIVRHGGYVDKFIGDAVMAMWGAPLDDRDAEAHAVAAAIDLRDGLAAVNREAGLAALGLPPLGIRIGINSGVAVVGNMGSMTRLNYTVTGDVVNLAARLESANTAYRTLILIGEETASRLPDSFVLRALDRVIVKGKTQAIQVFDVIARADRVDAATRARLADFATAMAALLARDFAGARLGFTSLAATDPTAALFAERAAGYAELPPPMDWSGSFALDKK